jgi:hypothetical protein
MGVVCGTVVRRADCRLSFGLSGALVDLNILDLQKGKIGGLTFYVRMAHGG